MRTKFFVFATILFTLAACNLPQRSEPVYMPQLIEVTAVPTATPIAQNLPIIVPSSGSRFVTDEELKATQQVTWIQDAILEPNDIYESYDKMVTFLNSEGFVAEAGERGITYHFLTNKDPEKVSGNYKMFLVQDKVIIYRNMLTQPGTVVHN